MSGFMCLVGKDIIPPTPAGLIEGLNEKHMGEGYCKDYNNPIVE